MHPIFVYTSGFLVLGGAGMHVANRRVDAATSRARWLKFGTYVGIVGCAIAAIFLNRFYWLAILITTVGLWEILKNSLRVSSLSIQQSGLFGYLLIVAGFLQFVTTFDPLFILFIYFQVFIFDGFSQVSGQMFGTHRLLPRISPGKTWEGLMGGSLFCLTAAIIARDWVSLSLTQALLTGLATAALSFAGDILASAVKRATRIKDYSQLLPGHGGFLDRFDSFLMTGAGFFAFSYLKFLVL